MSEICRRCSELTSKKENENALSQEEIEHFVKCVVERNIVNAQIDDMLRAMFNSKLNDEETTHLTRAMIDSGKIVWPDDMKGEIFVDKHSTGGVGDKVSLVLAPALAACGVKVPMLSGRGLEHTGGTLDKLESIPGFNVLLSADKFVEVVREVGCCIAGQTENLVPADKILYARRDATQTVDCTGLIISSIMSKKVAESLTALVLDVKVGKGAFKKDEQSARELATKMVNAGNGLRVKTVAYLTEMDSPLGNMIGNSLEVAESIKCLHGDGPHDLIDLVIRLGGQLLFQVGKASNLQDGCDQINQTLHNGTAIAKFAAMMKAQGVDAVVADRLCTRGASLFNILPLANYSTEIRSKVSGYIHEIDAMQCALASIRLGAGRMEAGQDIRFGVGLELIAHIGQHITEGSTWVKVYHEEYPLPNEIISMLQGALCIKIDNTGTKVIAVIE